MKKPHTMPDGKTRDASSGPWVALEEAKVFLAFCNARGHRTREHPGLFSNGYQIRYGGNWMGLLHNKGFRRYTADRRLEQLVAEFKKEREPSPAPVPGTLTRNGVIGEATAGGLA